MRIINIICSTLIILSVAFAQAGGVTKSGTTAAPFLNVDVGARANSMGGAYVSMADDATSMYWNPAGIALFTQPEAIFCHMRWIADITFNYIGFAMPLQQYGTIGVNATFLSTDQLV